MNNQIRHHKRQDNFTILYNDFLYGYGDVLSAQEKFILVYFLSRPDGWKFRINDLRKYITNGETAIRTAMKNLVMNGFISRVRDKKMFCHYHFFDDPRENYIRDYLLAEKQDEVLKKLYGINRKTEIKDEKEDIKNNLNKIENCPRVGNPHVDKPPINPAFSPRVENPHVENPHVENPHVENPQDIVSTDSNNIYIDHYPNFERWFKLYPEQQQVQKRSALNVWIDKGLEFIEEEKLNLIFEQTEAYSSVVNLQNRKSQFIKTSVNFLLEELYEDDYISQLGNITNKKKVVKAKNDTSYKSTEQRFKEAIDEIDSLDFSDFDVRI